MVLAYIVHISEEDRHYIDHGLGLSPDGRRKVWEFLDYAVADMREEFRLSPDNRVPGDQSLLRLRFVLRDDAGDGRIRVLDFYIDDAGAAAGVLLLTFINPDPK
jgi:hypothetical protein